MGWSLKFDPSWGPIPVIGPSIRKELQPSGIAKICKDCTGFLREMHRHDSRGDAAEEASLTLQALLVVVDQRADLASRSVTLPSFTRRPEPDCTFNPAGSQEG